MKVKVRYWTEFGGSESTMNVEEIANFSERFKIMSVTPHEELCPICNKHKIVDGHCDICTRTLCTPKETLVEDSESYELAEKLFEEIHGYKPEILAGNQQHELIVAALQKGMVHGAKWQAEQNKNKFNEEDFKLFARQYYREIKMDKSNLLWEDLADKCLEEFKKK